jgi:hypothetical protein
MQFRSLVYDVRKVESLLVDIIISVRVRVSCDTGEALRSLELEPLKGARVLVLKSPDMWRTPVF